MNNSILLTYLTDHMVPWPCWKSESLVYFPHNKCASTLYDALFNKLGWKQTHTQAIDWNRDTVISHIRRPIEKHYKGLIEGLKYFPTVLEFFQKTTDEESIKFLSCLSSIDPHSYTIHRYLGENAIKVHWIPIDTDVDHKQKLFEILEHNNQAVSQGVKTWFDDLGVVHPSTNEELDLYNRLISLTTPPEIKRYLDFDICLYDTVTKPKNFEPENYQFRINDLKKQNYSQVEAESIADQEVAGGEYLLWKY
jgi:hypothetical protein